MKNLVIVSLILLAVVVIGVIIRGTLFQAYLPEGFEDAKKEEENKKKDDKKAEDSKTGDGKAPNDKGDAVQLDTESSLKSFMKDNGSNKAMMNSITTDTQAMIQNQKELMDMMKNVQPALTQGMEFMKAFKGMMGN